MVPTYAVSRRNSVQLIGEDYWRDGRIIFVPIDLIQSTLFFELVNKAEAKAQRRLTDNEVNRIVNHLENGE